MKKKFLLIAFFFLLCASLHKQILGVAVRYALRTQCDIELAYRSLSWEEGDLIFSDLVLFDPTFHAHVEKVSLRLDWSALPKKLKGHLDIEHPYVSFIKQRSLPAFSGNSFDFTVSIEEGIIEWNGLAHFSLEHAPQMSHLILDWGASGVDLKMKEGRIEADLRKFRAELLKPFFPYGQIDSGHISGRAELTSEKELINANLKIGGLGINTPIAALEAVDGALSYHVNFGAKWDLQGFGIAQGKTNFFQCEGRGFFKSQWIESEVHFDDASFRLTGKESWNLECRKLSSEQLCLLKAGAVVLWPELAKWSILQGNLSGDGSFSKEDLWSFQFEGENLLLQKDDFQIPCKKAMGKFNQEGGSLSISDDHYDLNGEGLWADWSATARLATSQFVFRGGWDGKSFPIEIQKGSFGPFDFAGKGWIDPNFELCFQLTGMAHLTGLAGKKIPFHCPHLSKSGSHWDFDLRFTRTTWDLLRLCGVSDGKEIFFDSKCQFLGNKVTFEKSSFNELDASVQLPWASVLALGPLFHEWNLDLSLVPPSEETNLRLLYKEESLEIQAKGNSPPFELCAKESEGHWDLQLVSDLNLKAEMKSDGAISGHARWKEEMEAHFDGTVSSELHCSLNLPQVRFSLTGQQGIEGCFEGKGSFHFAKDLQANLDLKASELKIKSYPLENEGLIQFSYSSSQGARFEGINLHGPFDCAVDFLEYDLLKSHWIFHKAKVHLPGALLTHRFLQFLDKDRDLDFTADLDFASDFSRFVCTMQEGMIPFNGKTHEIENLHLFWNNGECKAALYYKKQLQRWSLHIDDLISGRLSLGEEEVPLTIDWDYTDHLAIRSIEGSFGGVEASFHAETENVLIGSAHLNFIELSEFVPAEIAEVFQELKMGKGYELKGRLKTDQQSPAFQGILSGKQLELFGFQFRTLMAQVDLGVDHVRLFDLKISDTAGIMKIEELVAKGIEDEPWTLEIPQITILEFRPSLMQRPGQSVGPISPLVVRELKLTDFKGLLDKSETYTAKGHLHFINSYKREETVFDLPANVLSRIVGLDLELLIPVCGDLTFDLKDGYFNLLELTNAFSEANRSEFFLEMDPPPRMDLDWNLRIYVKMKQFVLLKFTESFLISIEGQIDNPDFSLKRKGFFGLM